VPKQLYKRVWRILERTPGGLRIGDRHLPQKPTLSDLSTHELAFPLKVEELLLGLDEPLRRQIMVEVNLPLVRAAFNSLHSYLVDEAEYKLIRDVKGKCSFVEFILILFASSPRVGLAAQLLCSGLI